MVSLSFLIVWVIKKPSHTLSIILPWQLLQGDLAGKSGELVGTDGGDGIVKLGPEIKIWELAHAGRVVPGY